MKIIVPTDFSDASFKASEFAARMAHDLECEIQCVHFVHIDVQKPMVAVHAHQIEHAMIENARADGDELIDKLKSISGNTNLTIEVRKGFPVSKSVEMFATEQHGDLIVMGTKGATGLKKVLMGSNAAAVINECSQPVLTVPDHCRYKGIKNIVYASGSIHPVNELKRLIAFAGWFDADIQIVHFRQADSNLLENFPDEEKLKTELNYRKLHFHLRQHDDVLEGIQDFINEHPTDILSMFTHHLNFFERLFGAGLTRQMSFHSEIPLLSLRK